MTKRFVFVALLLAILAGAAGALVELAPWRHQLRPPPPPAGYAVLATLATSPQGAGARVINYAGLPLEICYAVSPSATGDLGYVIGNPSLGPTWLYTQGDGALRGCVADPGNDHGPYLTGLTAEGWSGAAVVQVDQEVP